MRQLEYFYIRHDRIVIEKLKTIFPFHADDIQNEYDTWKDDDYPYIAFYPENRTGTLMRLFTCEQKNLTEVSFNDIKDWVEILPQDNLPKYFFVKSSIEILEKLIELYPDESNLENERDSVEDDRRYPFIGRIENYSEFETQTQEWFEEEEENCIHLSQSEFWELVNKPNQQFTITNTITNTNQNVENNNNIKIGRLVPTISNGKKCTGCTISGRTSKTAIAIGFISNKTISC